MNNEVITQLANQNIFLSSFSNSQYCLAAPMDEASKTGNRAITLSLLIPILQSESTPPSSFTSVQKGKSKIHFFLCKEWVQQGILFFFSSGLVLIQSSIRPNFGEVQSVTCAALAACWVESTPGASKLVLWPRPSAVSQIHRTTE